MVHFDFNSTPFQIHDGNFVLSNMNLCGDGIGHWGRGGDESPEDGAEGDWGRVGDGGEGDYGRGGDGAGGGGGGGEDWGRDGDGGEGDLGSPEGLGDGQGEEVDLDYIGSGGFGGKKVKGKEVEGLEVKMEGVLEGLEGGVDLEPRPQRGTGPGGSSRGVKKE